MVEFNQARQSIFFALSTLTKYFSKINFPLHFSNWFPILTTFMILINEVPNFQDAESSHFGTSLSEMLTVPVSLFSMALN